MADSLNSLGSISEHLYTTYPGLPTGFSGLVLLQIVDMARQHVANYTGVNVGSNTIADRYQPAILDYAKADVIDLLNTQQGGEDIRLGELTSKETGDNLSAEQYRKLGEFKLFSLGKDIKFEQSL